MSKQRILHRESYLYPCQLSMIQNLSSKVQKFIFGSPINSYSTVFDAALRECDFIDHESARFSRINTLQLSEDRKCTVMYESDKIKFLTQNDNQIRPIFIDSQNEMLSNIVSLQSQNLGTQNAFSLAYLSEQKQGSECMMKLNIKGFIKQKFDRESAENKLNPETDQQYETSQKQIFLEKQLPCKNKFNKSSSIEFQMPLFSQQRQNTQPNFQIKSSIDLSSNSLTFFEKKSSIAYIYDMEYEAFSNVISCKYDQENKMMAEFEGNEISLLSDNLMVNFHSNGLIKFIDKRACRVVHVRNLLQEIAQFGERVSTQKQVNMVKFWNAQKTETIEDPIDSTFQFLINLKNKIYEVDIRNSRLIKEDEIFEFKSNEQLANYEIVQNNVSRMVAFTTESHSNFKAYVVEENKEF